jgi:hypothetical protein
MASCSVAIGNLWSGITMAEKLSHTNHTMWRAQVPAAVRGAHLEGHPISSTPTPVVEIDGKDFDGTATKVPNLVYEEWFAKDQQVLSFVLGSLAREILSQFIAMETTTALREAIKGMFLSRNRAHALNTRLTSQLRRRATRRSLSSSAR